MIIINSFQYRYNWIPATASSGIIIKSWLLSWTCFQGIPLNSGRGYDVFHVFLIFITFCCTFILRLLRAFLNFIVHSSLKQTTLHSRTWCLSRANRARSTICWSGVCRVFSRDWISLSWSEWWLCKTTSYGNAYSTYVPPENKYELEWLINLWTNSHSTFVILVLLVYDRVWTLHGKEWKDEGLWSRTIVFLWRIGILLDRQTRKSRLWPGNNWSYRLPNYGISTQILCHKKLWRCSKKDEVMFSWYNEEQVIFGLIK